MIIPIYKAVGQHSHQLAKKVGELYKTKATHTGTLDPMAEGVLIVLTSEHRFKKQLYANTDKVYHVEILEGIATDTDDILGKITKKSSVASKISAIEKYFSSCIGQHQQVIHPFSAKRVNGQSFFDLAKSGKKTPNDTEDITIHTIKKISTQQYSFQEIQKKIKKKVFGVTGDFRQKEILKKWQLFFQKQPTGQNFVSHTFEINCSKRTYIRSLVKEVAEHIDQPLMISQLIRTRNGQYGIADCVCLV